MVTTFLPGAIKTAPGRISFKKDLFWRGCVRIVDSFLCIPKGCVAFCELKIFLLGILQVFLAESSLYSSEEKGKPERFGLKYPRRPQRRYKQKARVGRRGGGDTYSTQQIYIFFEYL